MKPAAMLALCAALYADAPGWVREAAGIPAPPGSQKDAAVELLRERLVEVERDGKLRVTVRRAVRVQRAEGSGETAARQVYLSKNEKLRGARGWMVSPSGETWELGRQETVDLALVDESLYSEYRVRVIEPQRRLGRGWVFAAEFELDEELFWGQEVFIPQERGAVAVARLSVSLPEGWSAKARFIDMAGVAARESGRTLTWEARNLERIPEGDERAPMIAVELAAPAGGGGPGPRFNTWEAIGEWMTAASDGAIEPGAEVRAKAAELTAGAATLEEKISRIAEWVQGVRYVSIQTNISRGGGYIPNAAREVLAKGYGDCKDKTALMRSLLRALGVTSHAALVNSGGWRVREEWPSPLQFDHVIVAVRVPPQFEGETVAEVQGLGRLMFFDPTATFVKAGWLPAGLHDKTALVLAGGMTKLARLPGRGMRYDAELEAEYELGEDGSLTGRVVEAQAGEDGRVLAGMLERKAASLEKVVEGRLARALRGPEIRRVKRVEAGAGQAVKWELEFGAPRYAKVVGDMMLFAAPALLDRQDVAEQWKEGLKLKPEKRRQAAAVKPPAGFRVDELPEPVTVESPLGRFSSKWRAGEGVVHFEETLEIRGGAIGAEQLEEAKKFFRAVRESERASAVLVKK